MTVYRLFQLSSVVMLVVYMINNTWNCFHVH